VAIALANRLSHIAWVVLGAHSNACKRALRAGAHETPLTATQQAIQRDFSLLKTDEWTILAQQSPEIRETRG
jgi:hypothetical protein